MPFEVAVGCLHDGLALEFEWSEHAAAGRAQKPLLGTELVEPVQKCLGKALFYEYHYSVG